MCFFVRVLFDFSSKWGNGLGYHKRFKETKEKGGARVIVCFLKRDFFLKGKGGEKTNINQFLAHFE